jgi:hypothetical protein
VPAAFEDAAALLTDGDVGEARDELTAHLREALVAVASHRAQFLPLLERREAELERGTLSPAGAGDLLTLLGHTGPSGIERALTMLDAWATPPGNGDAAGQGSAAERAQEPSLLAGEARPELGRRGLDGGNPDNCEAHLTLSEALANFYRAELLRGRADPAAVVALYRSARNGLCAGGATAAPQNECQRAEWRLRQLESAARREGGRP